MRLMTSSQLYCCGLPLIPYSFLQKHQDDIDAPQIPTAATADILFINVHCQFKRAKVCHGTAGSDRSYRIQGNTALSCYRQEWRIAVD